MSERSWSRGIRPGDLGRWGEQVAEKYLVQRGYVILERDYRRGRGQADLIAHRGGTLVVLEIKTRWNPLPGIPFYPGLRQRAQLITLLNYYARSKAWPGECELEWVIVSIRPPFIKFEHIVEN